MTEVGWTELLSRAFRSPMTLQVILNEIENTTINRHPEEYYITTTVDSKRQDNERCKLRDTDILTRR